MERFLTLSEVRQIFGVSRSTLWRWVNEKGLKVLRVGNVTRVRESDLQAFLARHETGGANVGKPQVDTPPIQQP